MEDSTIASNRDKGNYEIWNFIVSIITTIITLIGIVITSIPLFVGKSLVYENTPFTPFINIEKGSEEKVKVFYEQKEIKNAEMVIFTFVNNGNEPIDTEDYLDQLTIEFDESTKIISAEIIETKPLAVMDYINGNSLKTEINQQKVILPRVFLNKNNSYSVKIILNDSRKSFNVKGVIKGIESINQNYKNKFELFMDEYFQTISIIIWASLLFSLISSYIVTNKRLGRIKKEGDLLNFEIENNAELMYKFYEDLEKENPQLYKKVNEQYMKYSKDNSVLIGLSLIKEKIKQKDKNREKLFKVNKF